MSITQLRNILPLPDEDLQQVLDYAATLSKQGATEHFNGILGESPQSIEFISSFNSRRKDPASSSQIAPQQELSAGVPKSTRGPKKKKAPLHTPAPRQIQNTYAAQGTAYVKKNEDDYITKRPAPPSSTANNAFTLNPKPEAVQAPIPKQPPSAAGSLISDFRSKSNSNSRTNSRTSSPAPPKTKVNITGGTSMHGASTILTELDSAIRTLEISTNASLLDNEKRKCNCIGTRHPLLAAAPNCLHCGKVICVKEGLGPCTFCGEPLLSAVEVQGMIRELREERGREKMALDASSHRRAEIAKKPLPFTAPRENTDLSPAELKAKEHRDRLLGFQAQNVKRTTVRDEAADFETPMTGGGNIWASPAERAKVLKKQQKVLAEQEWNARPEYEKRRQVVSIDLVKGKVVKKMGAVDRPRQAESESEEDLEEVMLSQGSGDKGGGTFSRNPLLGGLIKPVYDSGSGNGTGKEKDSSTARKKAWRRVQDDFEDNEAVILDGGVYGGKTADSSAGDEPACG
ncbi:Activating signal cointegrator 1 [Hyphodiscus hymeniophilus]|uniref:Activating signal cointegrator 1 n=1 Tax=Hyphodiscus hymeniophilus TaxID=353542 RepID=A0A9P6VR37_9HELO|nr:Activating signal cointegrator 1 [Hyphodiscus hymeniophilus]